MAAGKTIIVPQGLINPNTTTVIEIPAESQHESVFVANVAQPQDNLTGCAHLFDRHNYKEPEEFHPRVESSPLEGRRRAPPPDIVDSSLYNSSFNVDKYIKSPGHHTTTQSFGNFDFFGLGLPLKLTSKSSMTRSGSKVDLGETPTRTMVTTTKLINVTAAEKPWDYYEPDESPGWNTRYEANVDSPGSFKDMRYCDAQSSPIDGKDNFYSTIFGSQDSNYTAPTESLPGHMVSPIAREGYFHNEHGMPIGPSPPRSYYKQEMPGEHDRNIVSTVTLDESTGRASADVHRSGSPSPGSSTKPGGGCNVTCPRSGRACSNAMNKTFVGSRPPARPELPNIPASARPGSGRAAANVTYNAAQSPAGAGQRGAAGNVCPAAAANRRAPSPRTATRGPAPVAYMQAVPPGAADLNATFDLPHRPQDPNATFDLPHRPQDLNATFNKPHCTPDLNATFNKPHCTPDLNATFNKPHRTPDLNATFNKPHRTPDLNATFNKPHRTPDLNATFDLPHSTPDSMHRKNTPYLHTPNFNCTLNCPNRVQVSGSPFKEADSMEDVLLAAEKEEGRLIKEDLRRLQMERRRMFADADLTERSRLRKNLFGDSYKEEEEMVRCGRKPTSISKRPPFNRFA